jgi:TorA maturation chaperone TorD
MTSQTADIAFARAALYRFLSLAFSYPDEAVHGDLLSNREALAAASAVLGGDLPAAVAAVSASLASTAQADAAADFQRHFTLSASVDCPLNECAYGARHVFQEVQELADIGGFYKAFALELHGERPDALTAELEFSYLLALKQGHALEQGHRTSAGVCRDAARAFFRDHLGRWAENIGRRVELLGDGTLYASIGRLLRSFALFEASYLKPGPIVPHQEAPVPPEPLEEETCAAEIGGVACRIEDEDLVGELAPVAGPPTPSGG